jgi:hypothetical protein
MEALKRHRGGGEQTVTVKHVNVDKGGNRRRQAPLRSSRDSAFGATLATTRNAPIPDPGKIGEAIPISAARST